jgi:hypothetical protein
MPRGEAFHRGLQRPQSGNRWRHHPVPYRSKRYPWRVPPMACAACGERKVAPYRTLRTESGTVLVLHLECEAKWDARLGIVPFADVQ